MSLTRFFRSIFVGWIALGFLVSPASAAVQIQDWLELSDRDMSPMGRFALGLEKESWHHAESEHFIYHFLDYEASRQVLTETEVYYGWVKQMFGVERDFFWKQKCQVFVFLDERMWRQFKEKSAVSVDGDAFTNGRELYIYLNAKWLAPKVILAHELTHLILYRFLSGPIPLFLNEGFAEYIGYKAASLYAGGDDYAFRTIQKIHPNEYIPLEELQRYRSYPKDHVKIFYRESEFLVRYLFTLKSPKDFYLLLQRLSEGTELDRLIPEIYQVDLYAFEQQFKQFCLERAQDPDS